MPPSSAPGALNCLLHPQGKVLKQNVMASLIFLTSVMPSPGFGGGINGGPPVGIQPTGFMGAPVGGMY